MVGLIASLGCSLGALVVGAPAPTATPVKTPKPTFTFTPVRTPTFTPSITPTPTQTHTPTPTSTATPTPAEEETDEAGEAEAEAVAPEPVAEVQSEPAPPPQPTNTPAPEAPTATPAPAFPFTGVPSIHNTGSPGETRITGWVRIDYAPGQFKTLAGFQMKATAPDGTVYLSEMSGPGFGDSTVPGTGDNHWMNTKLEIRPYTPGPYKIVLVEGETQMSQEYEFTLSADPLQYVHWDFFKQEQN